jgi:hypothetical protein
MSEADLAAIPEWIQKSFADVLEYTETEKQKLLKVIWDSGASLLISHDRNDFVGPLDEAPMAHLHGLADGVRIEGVSHVAWTFLDCRGMLRMLKWPAYYVPTAGIRLLSMSNLLQEYPNEFLHADRSGVRLSGTFVLPVGGQRATNGVQATLDPQRTSQWPTPSITMVQDAPAAPEAPQTVRTGAIMVIQLDQVARPVCTDPASVEVPLRVEVPRIGAVPGHRIQGAARAGMTVGPLSIRPAGTILTTEPTATHEQAILRIQKQPPSTIFEI